MTKLTEDQFDERFHMIKNHLKEDAPFDGCMFETYGLELEHVVRCLKSTKRQVWTIIEGDSNDNLYYVSGLHIVNRLGFFLTEESVPEGEEIEVEIEFNVDN